MMINKLKVGKKEIIMLSVGVIGSYFFIIIGYFISSVLNCIAIENVLLNTAVEMVSNNPIRTYYTSATLVWCIFFCLVFNIFYLFVLIVVNKKEDNLNVNKQEVNNKEIVEEGVFDSVLQMDIQDNSCDDIVLPEEMNSEEISDHQAIEDVYEEIDEKNKIVELSSEIVTELLEDYNMSQVIAMSKISKYIEGINVDLLKRMFNTSMSADEIMSYIQMFYEE